jgi:hypothetical protein
MKTANFNENDYIISHFVANDEFRPKMNNAYRQNGFVYASNLHTLIKVPENMCAKIYEEIGDNEKGLPNFEKCMQEVEAAYVAKLNTNQILTCLDSIKVKLSGYETDCKKCGGKGENECECCANSSDCDECNGTGKIKHKGKIMIREVSFKKDDEEIRAIEIQGKKYSPVYLEQVIFAMLVKGLKKCDYYVENKADSVYHRAIFKFSGIEILVLGYN